MPRQNRVLEEDALEWNTPSGSFASDVAELPEDQYDTSDQGMRFDDLGGFEVDLYDEFSPVSDGESGEPDSFDANLADKLSETEQVALGVRLWEYVEIDLESRRVWEERMLDGLEIIGLQDIPSDAVAFEGAARVTYPGIAEAMVQFQARAMEELNPPEGPVKCAMIGKSTPDTDSQAQRVEDCMNFQLTEEDDEYYWEEDTSLLYLSYSGSGFKKVAPDPITSKTRSRFVTATDFIVPYWAKSLQTAPRYTHRYTMTYNDYLRAVDSGYFIDGNFRPTPQNIDTRPRTLQDVSDDRTESFHEDDHVLEFYEVTCDEEFKWETHGKGKFKYPYTITLERETQRVVRIARCWDEADELCLRDVWYTHEKFLPGLGFYGLGYLHLIGGLGRAAAGAIRLLLDGSATASLQGGFKSRDARMAGDLTFEPGVWKDVDMSMEDLSKAFYSAPFKEPSPALFKTLELLVTNIQRFAGTTEARVGDAPATGPVGTMVALIEQASKIFSGIHKRLHMAKRQEFKLIAKCNYRFLSDEYFERLSKGTIQISREDFNPETVDVMPVSDPNIFSSVQRIALAQAVVQSCAEAPDIFTRRAKVKAYRNLFKALKVPSVDEYLPEKPSHRLDPVAENEAIAKGYPVEVFREQDDASHLAVHQAFKMELQNYPPEVAKPAMMAMAAHEAAHMVQAWRKRVEQDVIAATGVPLPPFDAQNPDAGEELPPDIENAVARIVAGSPALAPPPAPPPANPEEAMADEAHAREQTRKDDAHAREEARKDDAQKRQLQRDGLITDVGNDLGMV